MTGAMPLVDEQSLSGVDFALPEYDDSDFSADMEPPPDRHSMSPDGERHAEEISKILAETDVYVKYGLHQKAVDHLRRVFLLDHENVEAHERLKDIFVSQGREQEAEVELLKLAETVASSDPDRAEAYLQELLAMNGTHTGAFELARRFRLRVARMSSVSAEVEYQGGGVAAVEVELDELDLSSGPMAAGPAMGVARGHRRDSVDDFDPHDLIGNGMAHGSPAPSRPPSRPKPHETENFELDFAPSPSQATRQMSPEHVDALANMLDDDDHHNANSTWNGSLEDAVDAHLDDDAIGVEIDNEVGAELHSAEEDLPFDPAAARAFDDAVAKGSYVSGYDEPADELPMQHAPDTSGFEHAPSSGTYDPYGTEAVQTPPTFDPTSNHTLDHSQLDLDQLDPEPAPDINGSRAESLVEDDLDEADFYTGQGMYGEAREVLVNLLERYPNHPLIHTKLRDVETLIATEVPHADLEQSIDVSAEGLVEEESSGGTDAIDLDELEEVDATEFEEVDSSIDVPVPASQKRKPSVMLERPVEEGDADTHYDLGLAYKEMGLFDEAMKAFEKVIRAPGREVQCRVMIGMCQREQGNPSEAIHQFKQGLHAEPSERERLSLYYEIGITYESIGDEAEALYYYESVTKRDPGFADAALRADQLRSRVGQIAHHDDDL
jgi:tetratricopeptide (TPR) repeat protein